MPDRLPHKNDNAIISIKKLIENFTDGKSKVALAAGSSTIGRVDLNPAAGRSAATLARPNNSDSYLANTVIAGLFTFQNVAPVAGSKLLILGACVLIAANTVPNGMGGLKLHLYSETPAAQADNAVFNLAAADRLKYLGFITLGQPVDFGDTLWSQNDNINLNVGLAANSTTLYGYLTTDNGCPSSPNIAYTVILQTAVV
jgi:hypothetical protein